MARLAHVPVWAFHSDHDAKVSAQAARRVVGALQQAGGTARLTEIDSQDHNCWSAAFEDYHLLEWLLSQRRGASSAWNGPGTISLRGRIINNLLKGWKIWQIALQAGVCLAAGTALGYAVVVIHRLSRERL